MKMLVLGMAVGIVGLVACERQNSLEGQSAELFGALSERGSEGYDSPASSPMKDKCHGWERSEPEGVLRHEHRGAVYELRRRKNDGYALYEIVSPRVKPMLAIFNSIHEKTLLGTCEAFRVVAKSPSKSPSKSYSGLMFFGDEPQVAGPCAHEDSREKTKEREPVVAPYDDEPHVVSAAEFWAARKLAGTMPENCVYDV